MAPSTAVDRAAVPLPPETIARPRDLVLMSTAVLPAATSRWKSSTSSVVSDATTFGPSSGLTWRKRFDRSAAQEDAFFLVFAAGPFSR